MIAKAVRRFRGKYPVIAIGSVAGFLISATPSAPADPQPPTLAALEAAAANGDAAGKQALDTANIADPHNGQAENPLGTTAASYHQAGGFDDRAGQQYAKATKDWKDAADTYKTAGEAIKGFNDAETMQLTGKMKDRQDKADASKQKGIESYNKAAVEYDKEAAASTDRNVILTAMEAATKSRESAANVGKPADKDDKP
jgi:hypothetical protein